jgi:N-acetylmuramoyl-L-alanine amidase
MYSTWSRAIALAAMLLYALLALPSAAAPTVTGVRAAENTTTTTRFVLDLTENVNFRVFLLTEPYRVVLDLPTLAWQADVPSRLKVGLIEGFRFGSFDNTTSRVVIDVNRPVKVERSFILPPQGQFPHRLVLDLSGSTRDEFLRSAALSGAPPPVGGGAPVAGAGSASAPISLTKPPPPPVRRKAPEKKVVVIDPGHGGVDPGAIGENGTFEKEITLAVGLQLKRKLEATGRYRVVMTRDRDVFVRLRDRVEIGRQAGGQLFISLHADSMPDHSTRGASVYTLSEKASDAEAEGLAARENRADLIAGVALEGESPEVTSILIDLARRETMNLSGNMATLIIPELERQGKVLRKGHRFAGFAVLKAPDVPSVLVEMGYLSNKLDERQLNTRDYQAKMADALSRAVDRFFAGLDG